MKEIQFTCPAPLVAADRVLLDHGGGGKLTQQLIERVFLPAFRSPALEARHDGGVVEAGGVRLAMTTDAYVVHPLFFPGGSIGELGVYGTVNDLAMCGARPLYLTAAFILEEGLPMETLRRVTDAAAEAARRAGVALVAGDTKVVDKGKGDGLFMVTAGVGSIEAPNAIGPAAVQPGDVILLSGDLGAHGVAILSVREGLEFESPILSDTAPLWEPVEALLQAGVEIHCLRDLTRGGLASALNEIASARGVGMRIEEALIPVSEPVRGACEILGLDPLYVANEGRFAAFVPAAHAEAALEAMRRVAVSSGAVQIGEVTPEPPGVVTLRSRIGGSRVVDMLSGEQLPRIC
ncbi:MAG: hydrogenase expression/formation protein HypE [Bryobacteraceae bacterium]|nr:hydrogenase expression/formation protein HypE [Bryobacteraceae bacterium]